MTVTVEDPAVLLEHGRAILWDDLPIHRDCVASLTPQMLLQLRVSHIPPDTGSVHIPSADDGHMHVNFDTKVDREGDVALMRHMYKVYRECGQCTIVYRGEITCDHHDSPVHASSIGLDVIHSAATRWSNSPSRQTLAVVRRCELLGTMKARGKGGVVDPRSNVCSIQSLKEVADMSITPANVRMNTCSTAIAMGEKGAVVVAKDLGVQGV
ncbi:hypothetical protein V8D89_003114 [Ganoderma adspersum]